MKNELYFNELSLDYDTKLAYETIKRLIGLCLEIRKFSNVNFKCRIASNARQLLWEEFKENSVERNYRDFFWSFFAAPFESDEVERRQDEYLASGWRYEKKECLGLAFAYILDSVAVSIDNIPWNVPEIIIEKDDKQVSVRNMSCPEHVIQHVNWIADLKPVVLLKSVLRPGEKKIDLRDDHGKETLMTFSKKLNRCPYVEEIVNSLPHNPYCRKFIKAVKPNGLIEIVLFWEDKGIGLVVRTTGRNIRETERIAGIIDMEYGHL